MRLRNIIKGIPCEYRGNDIEIKHITYDSRAVKPATMFFCIKGFSVDGHDYAEDAVKAGAAVLVVTRLLLLNVPQILVKDDRAAMALMSSAFYGHLSKKMRMIGVTGTNGKTSATYLLKSVFEHAGYKVGLIGTIVNMVGEEVLHTERTTPESSDLHELLHNMAREKCDVVVMEVSSHSLELKRVYGIEFEGGIFTNLTQDHLDFHGTFENYAAAKRILFGMCKFSTVNADDGYAEYMKSGAKGEVSTYSIGTGGDYCARDISLSPDGSRYVLATKDFRTPIQIAIPGMFSVYNSLCAAALSLDLGIDLISVKQGLEAVKCVAGRFERLPTHGRDMSIILDYCHTPDSLESTLKTVKGFAHGRVVCVFGCGGNRDAKKRPMMGEISAKLADFSVVTSDNPRFEKPADIIEDILAGMKGYEHKYIVMENRRDAIKYAIDNFLPGDIVLLAGKGHEDYQEIEGVKHPFDEKVVCEELLR